MADTDEMDQLTRRVRELNGQISDFDNQIADYKAEVADIDVCPRVHPYIYIYPLTA